MLGDGTYNNTNRPEQIVASNVTAIAGGAYHTLFVKGDGSLWAMGWSEFGQLGDGTSGLTAFANQPEQVASNVTAIAAGYDHSLFIKTDGSLWAMGHNYYGELGDGTTNNADQPEQVLASNVTAIAAGYEYSLFLKNDGSLWAMGQNNSGQLGDGTTGGNYKTNLPDLIVASNVTAIAAGGIRTPLICHSLFLKKDGSLWAMGDNAYGELGDGTYNNTNQPEQIVASNVTAIAAGVFHSLFLKSDGSMWAMGGNEYCQLGDGTHNSRNRPEQILGGFLPGYNQITSQFLNGTNMQLSFVGIAGTNYALDRSSSLSPPNWIPQVTNKAGSFGALVFTNAPDATTNNFWRIRSVP
jgi:alpha-tubulin suppressor-like RCC1 family protein